MKLVTAEQMRRLDATAIDKIGIPGAVLMENASHGVFEVISSREMPLSGKKACVLCGRGNNGGDGFAVARHLFNAGAQPVVVLAAEAKRIQGDALINLNICKKLKIPVAALTSDKHIPRLSDALRGSDFVVDALMGTGIRGEVKPFFQKVIDIVNRQRITVYAVDVPSGVNADDGRVPGSAIRAHHTITFGAPKIGLFVYPGAECAGQVYVADIGIPTHLVRELKTQTHLTSASFVSAHVRRRRADVNKGDCGKVLIVGGSPGMSGAVCLAGVSALHTGSGLVSLAVPETIAGLVDKKFTEGVTLPLAAESGALSRMCIGDVLEKLKAVNAVVLGPGMKVTDSTCDVVRGILEAARVPVVVDADGLNCLARGKSLEFLKKLKTSAVLTPHPGEMARLLRVKSEVVQVDRLNTARAFAKNHHVTLVLKGAYSLVASPRGEVYVNPTGNAGMATAGSGDVLSGIIVSLLGEGMDSFTAAVCGAYIHGLAGDASAQARGERAVTAGSIATALASVMKKLEEEKN